MFIRKGSADVHKILGRVYLREDLGIRGLIGFIGLVASSLLRKTDPKIGVRASRLCLGYLWNVEVQGQGRARARRLIYNRKFDCRF